LVGRIILKAHPAGSRHPELSLGDTAARSNLPKLGIHRTNGAQISSNSLQISVVLRAERDSGGRCGISCRREPCRRKSKKSREHRPAVYGDGLAEESPPLSALLDTGHLASAHLYQ